MNWQVITETPASFEGASYFTIRKVELDTTNRSSLMRKVGKLADQGITFRVVPNGKLDDRTFYHGDSNYHSIHETGMADIVRTTECPTCGSEPGERCYVSGNNSHRIHRSRIR